MAEAVPAGDVVTSFSLSSLFAGRGLGEGLILQMRWELDSRRRPLYLHGHDLCDGSDLRFGRWPPAKARGDVARFPLRLQPRVSFGIFAMSRTTEQSLEFRSHGQGRLP